MKLLSSLCGVIAALTIVGMARGQEKAQTIILRPAVVLIDAKARGNAKGAEIKEIEVPKRTITKKVLSDVRAKGKDLKGLDREYVVNSARITLADDTVVECQILMADEVPEKTTLRNLQKMHTLDAVCDQESGTWYGYLAKYEVVVDASKDSPAKKKDMAKLQGTWRIISSQVADEDSLPEEELSRRTFTVQGNKLTYDFKNPSGDKCKGTMDIDPATKAFDYPGGPGGETMLGIYELEGDNLKIAFGVDGLMRSKGFEVLKAGVAWQLALKRAEP
jgi:uncharacterized protein (TIGR03067 family)